MSLSRRQFVQTASASAAAVAAATVPGLAGLTQAIAEAPVDERPNLMWFRSEDNSASYLGCYGNDLARTPAIDKLATEGVRYTNFHTTSPVCAPTKLAILTGMYEAGQGPGHNMRAKNDTGGVDNNSPDFVRGFAAYLRDIGYWTTTSGNTDYNTTIDDVGFDDSRGNWQGAPEGAPFLAVLGTSTSHETTSFAPANLTTDPAAVRLPAYHPDTLVMRRDRAHYMDMVAIMDGEVGAMLQDLEDQGVADNTIVIYSSDHGGVLARSKRFAYDSGLHTPLVIRFPQKWAHLAPAGPGSVIDAPVSSIDMPATLLALAGTDVPGYMQGQVFLGPDATERAYAFSNRNRMDESIDFVRTCRDSRYRYIRNYMPHLPWAQHVQFMWLQASVREWEGLHLRGELDEVQSRFWGSKPYEELYDLQADPDEVTNLIDDPALAEHVVDMREALDAHMLRINDNGFAPEGSSAEGFYGSRAVGAYPLARLLALGDQVGRRSLSQAILADLLADDNEVIRWWAAIGLSILAADGGSADPLVLPVLTAAMSADQSPWVAVQVADALARFGHTDLAVPFLGDVVADESMPRSVTLQAVWALHYVGAAARPALPQLLDLAAQRPGLDEYDGQAARHAIKTISGAYVPTP